MTQHLESEKCFSFSVVFPIGVAVQQESRRPDRV